MTQDSIKDWAATRMKDKSQNDVLSDAQSVLEIQHPFLQKLIKLFQSQSCAKMDYTIQPSFLFFFFYIFEFFFFFYLTFATI